MAAEAATAEAVVAIAPAPPQEQQLYVPAVASKQRFLLNPEAIAQYSVAIASRRKRAVPAAVVVVDVAAMIAADAAAAAAGATKFPQQLH